MERNVPLFQFNRNLKLSRFTVDVLMQRLTHLKSERHCAPDECLRSIDQANASVTACDQLQNELHQRLNSGRPIDLGTMASMVAMLREMRRNVTESIARLNSFEYGIVR